MDMKTYDYVGIEEKWQKKWFENKIFESKKQNKKKFFIHFAYPGVSGYLHVGHMRGFTYCDLISRYKKMMGYDVLFPAGFHASGIPSIGFAKKVERKDPLTLKSLRENGLEDKDIEKLKDPYEVVNYFSRVYVEDYWKRFGFLIDYSRLMSTISKGYNKFIEWQFYKLKGKDFLLQKPHFAPYCPKSGPVAVDKSETDILKGGSAEILEFTTIKFKMTDGTILPAATLRPETIFGVTNMWVNPNVEYEKVKINDEIWICSKECINKISYQIDNVKPLKEKVQGRNLIGKTCKIPLVEREVPILSGSFADPNVATGIVMSVPAHAPYDWIALVESREDINPITIIDVEGFGTNPAKEISEELGIKSQNEKEKLDLATDIVYKKEFHTGYLNDKCGIYAGIKISEIKDEVKNDLINKNNAVILREFSEEVICRCGEKVIIKNIPDQWFIKYSDQDLTEKSKNHTQLMNIYPKEYKDEMPKVLDWFDDRACIRQGSWLGTEFPFKKGWIVEPISDSTLYSAYYIVSKYVNEGKIKPDDMTEEFFDYIFLARGNPKNKIWSEIKADFDYWYPVDINLGGKEHKTVHFPVFLMNHVAIMPKEKWPMGIFVHWWVTQKGKEKISKSKGGAEHITEAATIYGVDAMRLYYTHIGSPFVDIEWDTEIVLKYKNRIANIWKLVNQIDKLKDKIDENLDNWLKSIANKTIRKALDAFEIYDLRTVTNEVFFEFQKHLQWYVNRGGANKKLLKIVVLDWIKLMSPVTPHLAEELWEVNGGKNFVALEKYPAFDSSAIYEKDEVGEYLLLKIVDDVNEILKITKISPKKLCLYTSAKWKQKLIKKALDLEKENKLDMNTLMKTAISDPELKKNIKDASIYAQKLLGEIRKINENDKQRYIIELDERTYLEKALSFLERELHTKVSVFSADDKNIYDPANKSKSALPLRPAIYIE